MKSGIHHIGNWQLMNSIFSNLKKDLQQIQKVTLMQIGLQAEKFAKKHIVSQDLGWAPLSESYKKTKLGDVKVGRIRNDGGKDRRYKKKYSEKILIRTSSYLQSITSWVTPPYAYAGVRKTAKNKEGQTLADIAKTLEYGSTKQNIPPRPLWSVVMNETKAFAISDDTLNKVANRHFMRKYKVRDTKNLAK